MKTLKAVPPYIHPGHLNFKLAPYEAWVKYGGQVAKPHYPWRAFHGLAYRRELPSWNLFKSKKEARLRFVEPLKISFDTFPDYATHEIILFVWDCWPFLFERLCAFINRHHIRTAIFTCRVSANSIKERFPNMNIMYCPEGVDSSVYYNGGLLSERTIDLLEFGRPLFKYVSMDTTKYDKMCDTINYIRTSSLKKRLTDQELFQAMSNSKTTICYPHCTTEPKWCGSLETLTQRYWECMLSRIVILGHAPKELTDLIGYNPCIEVDFNSNSLANKVTEVLEHINDFQELVDKNRETAERMADWSYRMIDVKQFLSDSGYNC